MALPIASATVGTLFGALAGWALRKASWPIRIGSIAGGLGGVLLGFREGSGWGAVCGVIIGVCVGGAIRCFEGLRVDGAAPARLEKQERQRRRQLPGGLHSVEFYSVPVISKDWQYKVLGGGFSRLTTRTIYNMGDAMHHVASWKHTVLHPARLGLLAFSLLCVALVPTGPGFAIPGSFSLIASLFLSVPHYEMALRALTDRGNRYPGFMAYVRYCMRRPFRMVKDDNWLAFTSSLQRGD